MSERPDPHYAAVMPSARKRSLTAAVWLSACADARTSIPDTSVESAASAFHHAAVPGADAAVDASLAAESARDASAAYAAGTAGSSQAERSGGVGQAAPAAVDRFGVRQIYPTKSAGREWYLPDNAEAPSDEWNVESSGAMSNLQVTSVTRLPSL